MGWLLMDEEGIIVKYSVKTLIIKMVLSLMLCFFARIIRLSFIGLFISIPLAIIGGGFFLHTTVKFTKGWGKLLIVNKESIIYNWQGVDMTGMELVIKWKDVKKIEYSADTLREGIAITILKKNGKAFKYFIPTYDAEDDADEIVEKLLEYQRTIVNKEPEDSK